MTQKADRLARLAAKARSMPRTPGVYLMKDAAGRVLYVGKARSLPNRLASYFQPSTRLGPKKQPMLDLIEDFDVIPCQGEWEALLTENRLIKDLHPRFNELLTDGKSYPYLVITVREDFPGVFITRQPADPAYRGARILGPFTSVYALRESVKLLQRVFRFRTCRLDIRQNDDRRRFFRPCLLHAIKQCSAPCAARISRDEYRRDIDRFVRFLHSKRSVMLREMRQQMAQAAEARRYEQAAVLRDQIRAIEKLDQRGRHADRWQPETETLIIEPRKALASLQRVLGSPGELRCIEGFDIAHLQGSQTVASKVCFVDGRPLKNHYRHYRIRTADNDDYAAMREVISRAYRQAGTDQALYPDLVLIDGGPGQLSAAMEAFSQFDKQPACLAALAKKQELLYLPGRDQPLRLSRHHRGLQLCQAIRDEAHRFAQHYHHILRRKKTLEQ